MTLFVGCPIWSFRGWVGSFYPAGTKTSDFLREYSRRLTTVEGNTTFYAVPAPATLQNWAAEMPATFRFCPKVPRSISHAGRLIGHEGDIARFIDVMGQLGKALGPMFLQLPPSYPPGLLEDLSAFLGTWPAPIRLAVEVRHPDWFDAKPDQDLNRLLVGARMARVVIDTRPIRTLQGDKVLDGSVYLRLLQARQRKPNLPVLPERTTDFVFVRYIGHPEMAVNEPFLDEWAGYLAAELGAGSNAFVFCHCPDERLDPWLCYELYQRVAALTPLPPLPWDSLTPDEADQRPLF